MTDASPTAENGQDKPVDLRKLLRAINDSFSEDDLRDLCFELRLDFENLPGQVKKDKARELIIHFYVEKFKREERLALARDRFNKSLDLIRSYIFGLVILTLISAAMNFVVFLVFGLKFALFWAVFLALLNLIPFIGNPIGLAIIMMFAIITKENMLIPLLIFVALFVMNFLQDNVIRPMIVGDKLKINAFAVFVAIIIGGMIWGVSGMILFIPIVGVAKIILESRKESGVYAILFSELPKNKKLPEITNSENE